MSTSDHKSALPDTITYNERGDAQSFTGEAGVNVFRMAVLASGLLLYARTGMKPNRAYTPTNMMTAARECLGDRAKGIGARDYYRMAEALQMFVQEEKARIAVLNA